MLSETLLDDGRPHEEKIGRLVQTMPMRRPGTADEIVQAMLWICSPENSFMTGHSLVVDGGLVRNLPVDIARAMGADVVIAVNVGTPLMPRENLSSALNIAWVSAFSFSRAANRSRARICLKSCVRFMKITN